jgi:hypothetical protein
MYSDKQRVLGQKPKYSFKKGSIRTTTEVLGPKPSASTKPKYSDKTLFQLQLVNQSVIGLGSNPDPRREMQATDRLDNDTTVDC